MTSLPQTLGNYRIIAKLGQGGMARALLAMRQGPGGFRKLFVLKHLRQDLPSQAAFIEMFLDEARLAAMLSHPNVVQTHEIGREGDNCFISMDYLEGQTLGRVLRRVTRPQVPLGLHVHVIAEVLAGLNYAHELDDFDGSPLSVVHRDVSPGNVFLTYDGQVKLLDFGIAKAAGAQCHTEVGVLKGKLAYMAPEQALSQDVDRRADVFAVGVMLWEALAARRLVKRGDADPVTLHNRVNGLWDPISLICPDAPPALISACEKAMALEPDHRYASAQEFRADLLAYLSATSAEPTREQLSQLVTGHFALEREQIASKIAAQIDAGLPPLDGLTPNQSPSYTEIPIGRQPAPTTVPPPGFEPDITVTTLRPRSASWKLIALGAMATAIGLALFLRFVSSEGQGSASDARAGTVESAAEPAIAALGDSQPNSGADSKIEIKLAAEPATAKMFLDGEPIANPYRELVSKGMGTGVVTVMADGYQPLRRKVRLEENVDLNLVLNKLDPSDKASDVEGTDAPDKGEASESKVRASSTRAARQKAARAREKAAKAEAKAAREAKEREAKALAEAKASAAKTTSKPKAGDALTTPKDKASREIDKTNPYQ